MSAEAEVDKSRFKLSTAYTRTRSKRIFIVAQGTQDHLVPSTGPLTESKSTLNQRIKTFEHGRGEVDDYGIKCNDLLYTKREELAEAGFFFTGRKPDHVECFYCGGGLFCWINDDNPWVEHSALYPDCAYMKMIMGEDFVHQCSMIPPNLEEMENYYKKLDALEKRIKIVKTKR